LLAAVDLRLSSLGDDIGLKGAALLAFRSALNNETLLKRMTGPMLLEQPELDRPARRRASSRAREKVTVT
jgi:hypothetical protein